MNEHIKRTKAWNEKSGKKKLIEIEVLVINNNTGMSWFTYTQIYLGV